MSQTIVALATPYGRSGIGVLRLSGPQSLEIVEKLTREKNFNPAPRRAVLKSIYDLESSELIDETLITYFKSPHSFTGEDVVEISCHGSPILLRQILDFCLLLDARVADAGEFSLRALANGRLDLSQAEAIRDLIDAQTTASARQAVRQLRGELSGHLQSLKDDLLNVIVFLESSLEFVEDDLPDLQLQSIKNKLNVIVDKLEKMGSTFRAGRLLREGIKVVLAGRPNVGKSSIFNSLIGHDRAIVTEIAGTTRDSLHETLSINGIPVSLIDTAGLRETTDAIESIGVNRAKGIMADSDLVVVVLDYSEPLTDEDRRVLSETEGVNRLFVINKIDLPKRWGDFSGSFGKDRILQISVKQSLGLEDLQKAILEPFLPKDFSTDSGFLVSDARHFDLLNRAKVEITSSVELMSQGLSEEIILIGLHNAMKLLGQITGETTTEDMLTRVFSTFCIGK